MISEITAPSTPGKPGRPCHLSSASAQAPCGGSSSVCGAASNPPQVGNSFFASAFAPESDLSWSNSPINPTPGNAASAQNKCVYSRPPGINRRFGARRLGRRQVTPLPPLGKPRPNSKADDAKVQVANRYRCRDDTRRLKPNTPSLEMGPKVVPVLKRCPRPADDNAKPRLQKLINAVSPPSLTAGMKQH